MSPQAPITTLRLAFRVANGFIIDTLMAYRGERDFSDALILAAVVQCNSAPLAGDPALQRRHGTFDAPAPDSLRRAVSINAVAASLGLPFETVRRRIKRLIAEGVCETVPEGVRLVGAALRSKEQQRSLLRAYDMVRKFYFRLKAAGCIELMNLPASQGPGWSAEDPPVRIVWRAASDYLLRMMEHLLPQYPNLSRAFVLLTVVRVNTEHLPDSMRGGEGMAAADHIPDTYRRPARASEVAALLGLPHETVRRNLSSLAAEGNCRRVGGGFVVPAEVLTRQNVVAATGANFRDLTRMFAELAELGVLLLWDAELAAERDAA